MSESLNGLSTSGGRTIFICHIIFSVLAYVALALRFWAVKIRDRALEAHDYLILIAAVPATGLAIDQMIGVDPGPIGLHVQEAERAGMTSIEIALKTFMAASILFTAAATFTKLSILHLYLRVFKNQRAIRVAAYTLSVLCILFLLAVILTACLICRPINYTWDKTVPGGHCGSSSGEQIWIGVVNLILDLAIVLLPTPVLGKLQMQAKRKIAVMGLLSLGVAVCTFTLVRIILAAKADQADFTYSLINAALFSMFEAEVGIIAACLPIFAPTLLRECVRLCGAHRKGTAHSASKPYNSSYSRQKLYGRSRAGPGFDTVTIGGSAREKGAGRLERFERLPDYEAEAPGYAMHEFRTGWGDGVGGVEERGLATRDLGLDGRGAGREGLASDAIRMEVDVEVYDSTRR